MNCKPGDLAMIVGSSEYAGRIVDVLYAAPAYKFDLPDGYPHAGQPPGKWVIRFAREVRVPLVGWPHRMAKYGCADDSKLRPLLPARKSDEQKATIEA